MTDQAAVIIVTFNSEKTIKECLDSVLKCEGVSKIVVVDNDSQDETKNILPKYKEKIKVIYSDKNLGFSKGNNLAFEQINTKYFITLNPDAKFKSSNDILKLVDIIEQNSDYGIIGPKLFYPNGDIQKTVRNLPTVMRAFQEYILNQRGIYDFYIPDCNNLCEVESIVGACMIINSEKFKKVDGFDEGYFLYFEDLELCRQIKKLEYKVGYFPNIEIEHIEGESGRKSNTLSLLHSSAQKYHGLLAYYLIQIIIRLGRISGRNL